jgi:hypothetical protein
MGRVMTFGLAIFKSKKVLDEMWPMTRPQLDPETKQIVCEIMAYMVLKCEHEKRAEIEELKKRCELYSDPRTWA